MKKSLLTITLLLTAILTIGQVAHKANDIYVEVLGSGLFGSINYERQLTSHYGLGARIGAGFYSEDGFYLTLPVGVNYLFQLKGKKSFIDAGVLLSFTNLNGRLFGRDKDINDSRFVNVVPNLGYRYHTKNDVMWRISLTQIINKYGFVPWFGISIGKRF